MNLRPYALILWATLFAFPSAAQEKTPLGDVIVQCAACHGADGIARSADVPHLAGQQELYLFNQLTAFKTGKRPHREMRYMSRLLSNDEMREIARHYSSMPR